MTAKDEQIVRRIVAAGSAIFILLACLIGVVGLTQRQDAVADAPLQPLYTRVPFTPAADVAALASIPPSFTPNRATRDAVTSAGTLRPSASPTATPDLSGFSLSSDVGRRATATPSGSGGAAPSPTLPAASSPTPPSIPPGSGATATPQPAPTAPGTPTLRPSRTPTPVPTAVPTATAPPRNPRKGIAAAYAYEDPTGYQPFGISWYYTWSLFPGLWGNDPNLEFVPMWPCNGTVGYVVSTLGVDYSGYLLILNEPEQADQCTMSVDEAAQFYVTVRNALPNARLIGPQTIARSPAGSYTAWTAEWRNRVRDLTGSYPDVAGYGIHVYPHYEGSGTPQEVLGSWCSALQSWGEIGQKELWVTEFGIHNFDGTPEQVRAAVLDGINLFETGIGACQVARYAYFTERWVPVDPANPTPTIAPGGRAYFDLYWRNSYQLSYTGQAYRDAGR